MAHEGLEIDAVWTTIRTGQADIDLEKAICEAFLNVGEEGRQFECLAMIAHELRGPLASIRGYVDAVLNADVQSVMIRQYLEAADAEARRLTRLIDGMFEMSRLDLRTSHAAADHVDICRAVSLAIASVAPMSSSASVVVESTLVRNVCVRMGCDSLTQVTVNVLTNAIQYGRRPGRVILTLASVTTSIVELWIEDDGPGIRSDDRERIFAAGERGDMTRCSGTGLGLMIVRRFLARAGGSIDVGESAYGGACFRIVLPRCADCRNGQNDVNV